MALPGAASEPETLPAEPLTGATGGPPGPDGERIVSDREKVDLLADSNVAEAVERRPDLAFANVTIDGEKATVSLEDIPADQVESAEVSKAATPDLDADTRGGGLNLRSKATYALEERVLKGGVETRFNPLIEDFWTEGNLTYGRPMGNWGFMATLSGDHGRGSWEGYDQDWRAVDGEAVGFVLDEQEIRNSQEEGREYKFNGTVDFRLSEEVRLYVKGDYRNSANTGYRPVLRVRYGDGEFHDVSDSGATVSGAVVERDLTGWESESVRYSVTTGGYLDYEKVAIDYQVSTSHRNYLEPDWFVIDFEQDGVELRYELADRYGPSFTPTEAGNVDLDDPGAFLFDRVSSNRWEQDNREWVATLNAKVPLRVFGLEGHVKGGFKARDTDFAQRSDSLVYDGFDGRFTLADVVSPYRYSDILDGRYDHGRFPGTQASRDFLAAHRDAFQLNETWSREESDPGSYDVNQQVSAGYGLFYLRSKTWRMMAGVRFEETALSYRGNELILDENGRYTGTHTLTDENRYGNWFPGIHGRYDAGKFSFVGSWSNTIERPYFGSIVPFRHVDREDQFIDEGNPELKPTLYTNYDFGIDYQVNESDRISVEFFYQTVSDIVYYEVSLVEGGAYDGFERGTRRNGPSADIAGVRLIWSQGMGKWFPPAEGFSVNLNYTWQTSETEYPGRPGVVLPVTRRPQNVFEASLKYDRHGIFAQLEVEYEQAKLEGINDDDPWRDRYGASSTEVDFNGSYELREGLRLIFEVRNLTNALGGEDYYGDGVLLSDYGWRPRSYRFGFKFDL